MNLTLGFIAFFISIIIPGILFRRFFFYGEFSKQFNTKDPVLHNIFLSIIPGIVIQVISFIIYHLSVGFNTNYSDVFTIVRDITSDGSNGIQETTSNFINDDIITFFLYSLSVFILASFFGWISSRIIRNLQWDKKYKLFRFNNQWYYIFSGEVLNMKKFEEAHHVSFKSNKGEEQDTLITYADILVSVSDQNDRKELYTGYVVDYDLQSDDITQLDKIYLIDTHRYKKKEKVFDENANEIKNDDDKSPTQSRNRLRVPGDVFVLNAKNIVNLNLTYIPSIKKKIEKKKQQAKKQKIYKKIQTSYVLIVFFIIIAHAFYGLLGLEKTFLKDYFVNTSFWGKLLVILFLNQLLSLFMPSLNKEKKLCYNLTRMWFRVLILFLWGTLVYFTTVRFLLS